MSYLNEIDSLKETIKGLDRRNASYMDEINRLTDIIRTYQNEVKTLQSKVDQQDKLIASLTAGKPTQERVGMLEAYHDRIIDQETVIELMKVKEQEKGGE